MAPTNPVTPICVPKYQPPDSRRRHAVQKLIERHEISQFLSRGEMFWGVKARKDSDTATDFSLIISKRLPVGAYSGFKSLFEKYEAKRKCVQTRLNFFKFEEHSGPNFIENSSKLGPLAGICSRTTTYRTGAKDHGKKRGERQAADVDMALMGWDMGNKGKRLQHFISFSREGTVGNLNYAPPAPRPVSCRQQ